MSTDTASTDKFYAEVESLRDIALFLEGIKNGKGNLLPLGTIVLDNLWGVIKELNFNKTVSVRPKEPLMPSPNEEVKEDAFVWTDELVWEFSVALKKRDNKIFWVDVEMEKFKAAKTTPPVTDQDDTAFTEQEPRVYSEREMLQQQEDAWKKAREMATPYQGSRYLYNTFSDYKSHNK